MGSGATVVLMWTEEIFGQSDGLNCWINYLHFFGLSLCCLQVFTVDVSKQLHEYEVEYHVLQEEMSSPRSEEMEALRKAEATNRTLLQQNQALLEQLEVFTS